jgi:hypothetical protein
MNSETESLEEIPEPYRSAPGHRAPSRASAGCSGAGLLLLREPVWLKEITGWIDDGATALCPRCGEPRLAFLWTMDGYWF